MTMNEKVLQNKVFDLRQKQGHKLIVPNVELFYGFADVISITDANLAVDHEIKLTKADFKNEFKSSSKIRKHQFLDWAFHKVGNQTFYPYVPNYFCYVVPAGLIEASDVQEYAGLLYYYENLRLLEVIKPARRLHSVKINKKQKEYLERGLMLRYWKNRK